MSSVLHVGHPILVYKLNAQIKQNSHCVNHRIFKEDLGFETYLVQLNCQVCILCQQGKLGDEFPYLFECPSLATERAKYLTPNTLKMPFSTQPTLQN